MSRVAGAIACGSKWTIPRHEGFNLNYLIRASSDGWKLEFYELRGNGSGYDELKLGTFTAKVGKDGYVTFKVTDSYKFTYEYDLVWMFGGLWTLSHKEGNKTVKENFRVWSRSYKTFPGK